MSVGGLLLAAVAPARLNDRIIPAEPPLDGVLWTLIVPAGLLAVSCLATYLLYRRFAEDETRRS